LKSARQIGELVRRYVQIQEDLFKPSLRKLIRIPGIYRPVDYAGALEGLSLIERELEEVRRRLHDAAESTPEGREFLSCLRDYVQAMPPAMHQLKGITTKLLALSRREVEYPKAEYKKDIHAFQEMEAVLLNAGAHLNRFIGRDGGGGKKPLKNRGVLESTSLRSSKSRD
jgi:hypothetical protein